MAPIGTLAGRRQLRPLRLGATMRAVRHCHRVPRSAQRHAKIRLRPGLLRITRRWTSLSTNVPARVPGLSRDRKWKAVLSLRTLKGRGVWSQTKSVAKAGEDKSLQSCLARCSTCVHIVLRWNPLIRLPTRMTRRLPFSPRHRMSRGTTLLSMDVSARAFGPSKTWKRKDARLQTTSKSHGVWYQTRRVVRPAEGGSIRSCLER